jgi:hypothetical protein
MSLNSSTRSMSAEEFEGQPLMETTLLRAGGSTRNKEEENKDWAVHYALVKAVEDWTRAVADASVSHTLGRSLDHASTSATSSRGPGPSGAAVAEKKKEEEETMRIPFDQWNKAGVDRVYHLIVHAKDRTSMGQYTRAHRLLLRQNAKHKAAAAVLSRKAADKLKDANKINWLEIGNFINDHELRDEQRLAGVEVDRIGMESEMIGRGRGGGRRRLAYGSGDAQGEAQDAPAGIECFNCGKLLGHMAQDDGGDIGEEEFDGDCGRRTGRAHQEPQSKKSFSVQPSKRITTDRGYCIGRHRTNAKDSDSELDTWMNGSF